MTFGECRGGVQTREKGAMAKLVLMFKDSVIGEYPIEKERLTIGRRAQNDIPIDNLAVSGEHAAVVNVFNYHFVEDLGSTNGTLVNGKEVKKQVLSHNDLITVGKHQLRYINEQGAAAGEFDKTVVIRRPAGAPAQAPADQDTPAAPARRPSAAGPCLRILSGPNSGKELRLTSPSTSIGRQGQQLAVILRQGSEFFIDRGAAGHTPKVNGQAIAARQALHDGDVVELENIRVEFCAG